MRHIELEELLVIKLLEVGRRVYQAALDERTPGRVLAPVINADGHGHSDQHSQAHRLMMHLEIDRIGDEEDLTPLEAEWNRFISTACDVWGQNQRQRFSLMKSSNRQGS